MDSKIDETFVKYFWVYDSGTPVTGLAETEFTRVVFFNAAVSPEVLHTFEVDASGSPGLYRAALTPNQLGSWFFYVQSSSYTLNPDPVSEELRVLSYTTDDLFELITTVPPGGTVLVDTDYGGTDNLRYVDAQGSAVADAEVRAYLKTDYDNGSLGASFIKSATRTDVDGRLTSPLVLSPEYWYKIAYVVPGRVGDVKELYVS